MSIPITPVQLTESEFTERFKPIRNLIAENPSWDGMMFETFGAEETYVKGVNESAPLTVWTQVSDDEGELVIVNGYHHVNRMGYLITSVPVGPDDEFLVVDDDYLDCRYCDRPKTDCEADPCEDRRSLDDDPDEEE